MSKQADKVSEYHEENGNPKQDLTGGSFANCIREDYRDRLAMPVRDELLNHMLPFWLSLQTKGDGASAGFVDAEGVIHEEAPRSLIYTSRMLWTYAELSLAGFTDAAKGAAGREFRLLAGPFRDQEKGGYYQSVSPEGLVLDDMKLVYAQGFVLYALAAWYRASGDAQVLSLAKELFALLELRCRVYYNDVPAYGEAYSRDFRLQRDNPLSTHGDEATVSMNTVLHLIEAYTGLYQAWPNPNVRSALLDLLDFFAKYIYNPAEKRLNVFLDERLVPSSDIWSYGHDIEAAWLVEYGVDVLEQRGEFDPEHHDLPDHVRTICRTLEDSILPEALEDVVLPSGRLGLLHINERYQGRNDRSRVWWVQAEALSALLNAGLRREDESYFAKAVSLWQGIEELICDRRIGGEWFEELDQDNKPRQLPRAHAWKAFYHNGRACLNVLRFFNLLKQ